MIATIIEIGLATLVLIGIIKEEKLIAWEDKMLDKAAKAIAKIILARRRHEHEKAKLAPMPGIKAYIAPKRHSKANLVCSEFEF